MFESMHNACIFVTWEGRPKPFSPRLRLQCCKNDFYCNLCTHFAGGYLEMDVNSELYGIFSSNNTYVTFHRQAGLKSTVSAVELISLN